MNNSIHKAMLLAAGLGTRLKPFTDKHPKALAVVNNKTLLQRNIEYLQQFGIKNIIVNVHHFAEQIVTTIQNNNGWGSNITISDEGDEVLETGGGLKKAAWYFAQEENFLLMNVDMLTDMNLSEMITHHITTKALATLAVTNRTSSRYLLFDKENRLCGWKNIQTKEEKLSRNAPDLVEKAFSGIHIIRTELLSLIHQQGKFSMIDVYLSLASNYNIQCYHHHNSKLIDVGKPENLQKALTMFE
ncbi:MAG: NTP transferase domain-containing protein [Chitinophagaceae bacterium]|nr:NTP transferase domain-containing protein [Chitinophagaceae bacterium]MCW5904260.1 NTP transferase domain-containing protein [Chitinophagaceae bacterium]